MGENAENKLHWSEEKEVISNNRPLEFLLWSMKKMPSWVVHSFVYPVSVFYCLFSKRARDDAKLYQTQLKKYLEEKSETGKTEFKISPLKQIFSFSMCVIEKMEGWLGKVKYENLIKHEDDISELISRLNEGKGALIIGSHLGNMELLRSISNLNNSGTEKDVEVTCLMELQTTQQFNNFLTSINPNAKMNILDSRKIGPDTMDFLQEQLEKGGMVFLAADRTSATSKSRNLREKFLGKEAEFPYGVFLLACLLKVPTYYIFGLREKTISLISKNHIYIEKSNVDFEVGRTKREEKIHEMCREYIEKLEKYIMIYPYQWYNFYNFWLLPEEKE